jgi:hypothetical protein
MEPGFKGESLLSNAGSRVARDDDTAKGSALVLDHDD